MLQWCCTVIIAPATDCRVLLSAANAARSGRWPSRSVSASRGRKNGDAASPVVTHHSPVWNMPPGPAEPQSHSNQQAYLPRTRPGANRAAAGASGMHTIDSVCRTGPLAKCCRCCWSFFPPSPPAATLHTAPRAWHKPGVTQSSRARATHAHTHTLWHSGWGACNRYAKKPQPTPSPAQPLLLLLLLTHTHCTFAETGVSVRATTHLVSPAEHATRRQQRCWAHVSRDSGRRRRRLA